jgi:hypothetical protein
MAHPNGGKGNRFATRHTFEEAYALIGDGLYFRSTTNERIQAAPGIAADGITRTIVFEGERNRHGNCCSACWRFRDACTGTHVGHCVEGLDRFLSKGSKGS